MSQPLAKLAVFLTPKRAWSQFRLRTLLALVALAALPCGWLKWTMVQKENELATAAEIKNRGDRVEYNWQVARKSSAPGPAWLRKLLGDDFFASVASINLWPRQRMLFGQPTSAKYRASPGDIDPEPRDDDLRLVGTFRNLEVLYAGPWLAGAPVEAFDSVGDTSDAGLFHLRRLANLRRLTLHDAKITNGGLLHLKGLTRLEDLRLSGPGVTDASLAHISGLAMLKKLDLSDTSVTDAGMVHLEGLTRLEVLILDATPVTGAGLFHLKGLPHLKALRIEVTAVSDTGLVQLRGLTELEALTLDGTASQPACRARVAGRRYGRLLSNVRRPSTSSAVSFM